MHGLDIIIIRNAEAAGRECAHARNDGNEALARAIGEADVMEDLAAPMDDMKIAANRAWCAAYRKGREEG